MADAEIILRDLLRKLFNSYSDDTNVKALTTGGGNYTSALYKIEIPNDGTYLKLFGKVAIVSEQLRDAMNAEIMYGTEQYVYTDLIELYNTLEKKYDITTEDRFIFPKCYGCNPKPGEETIILDDLTAIGYCTYNRFESVDWEHSKSAIANLAKFHSLSFAYKKEQAKEYDELVEKFTTKSYPVSEENKVMMSKFNNNAIEIVDNEGYKRNLKNFLKLDESVSAYMEFKMPINVPVLIHGDYRLSNLLFRRLNGSLETIVVDYQTVHAGSPVADLLYFIFTGTDEEFRRHHYEQLLDHYHNELSLALGRFKIDINDVYPRETFESELKQMLPKALRMSVVILPIVTVEASNAPQVSAKDADVSEFVVKPNELFAERFNGLVRDCVKWGVI